jgi:hypothetical protein
VARRTKYRVVEVVWTDTASDRQGWQPVDNEHSQPLTPEMRSVGYFLKRTKRFVHICQSVAPGMEQTAERLTIPAGCVVSVRRL